ncbi:MULTISPECIES: OmpA family protein [Pasteurellaceae]|uniref:OmpA family protein n=1 Tax=Pasteurella atlantica TaxID=2827233 RepID=A0AAW8CT50_9PAST|nr:OmpA family protein [Pasteurella atlantica]MBR0573930.1 OmpA family protein [Pasteurella atlantica]MDP8039926.1 OmpA family protein [Pasteurella atlantica]MDP8042050.1 OmpA family protein [Pasteurella atlantica]MDP8044187.1 OmpA family protein [Pasteurella atlantica]MDP8046249.1 OmpA family protein [Pasteurella atlantica]
MKLLKYAGLTVGVLSLMACTSTLNNINDTGALENTNVADLVWPEIDDATQPEGIFPNLENLDHIGPGVTKKDLYYLIERPHFSETHGVREWNYIMKFRQADRSVKICQYKVLFDNNMVAQRFYWLPKDCLTEKFDLAADALFPFDRSGVKDIKLAGKQKLDKLATHITSFGNKAKVRLVGHTDYIGSDSYNQKLSEKRASSVGRYLVMKGVKLSNITTLGMGEKQPVKQCAKTPKAGLVKCLAPNRRVSVEIVKL